MHPMIKGGEGKKGRKRKKGMGYIQIHDNDMI